MKKKCERCKKSFTLKKGRGIHRVKYCLTCRPIVYREIHRKAEKKRDDKRSQEKGYIVPKPDDVFFYGYKEPLKKFTGGYGYYGVVTYSKDRDKMQCHFCGKLFRNVGVHARFHHEIPAEEYKKRTGLAQKTALVGEGTRDALITAHKTIPCFSLVGKTKQEISERMRRVAAASKNKGKQGWSLEKRNQEGNCPEQLIERIKSLAKKLGRRPTAKEYAKEYGSYGSVITVYGKWNEALKFAGMTTFTAEKALKTSREFLIGHLQKFYREHKRTARTSDMQRGLLPCHQVYCKVFGTLNNARQEAKVPVVIRVSKYRYDEVDLTKTS